MANWSDTHVEFSGDPQSINKAWQFISSLTSDLKLNNGIADYGWLVPNKLRPDDSVSSCAGYSSMEICHVNVTKPTAIIIDGQGRWCCPCDFFKLVARIFELDLLYDDAECGCNFYHRIRMENGNEVEDEEFDFQSIQRYQSSLVYDAEEELQWYWDQDESYALDESIEEIIDTLNLERPADANIYQVKN
jgi:hypothetical protein